MGTWYGTDTDTYYCDEQGREWHVAAHDVENKSLPEQVERIPKDAVALPRQTVAEVDLLDIEAQLDAAGTYVWIFDLVGLTDFGTPELQEQCVRDAQTYVNAHEGPHVSVLVRLPRRGEVCGFFREHADGNLSPSHRDWFPFLEELTQAAFRFVWLVNPDV